MFVADLQINAEDICVGDIIYIKCDEEMPCDMLLLVSSEHHGQAYIEVIVSMTRSRVVSAYPRGSVTAGLR